MTIPYDHKVDLFSIGCIIFQMATGKLLIMADSVKRAIATTKTTDFRLVVHNSSILNQNLKDLLC